MLLLGCDRQQPHSSNTASGGTLQGMTAPTLRRVTGELAACDDARPESAPPPVAMNGAATTLSRRRRWRGVVGCLLAALLVVEAGLVGPDFAGALRSLSSANAGWLVVATVAAAVSMSMFARARCRLLRAAGVVVTLRGCVAAVYAANSLHATLPGGGAFSTGYSFRWMRCRGASGAVATWCLAASGLVSTGSLVALGLLGSLLADGWGSAVRLTMEITGVLALAMCARYLGRRLERVVVAGRWVLTRANRVRHRHPAAGADVLDELVAQLRSVRPSGRDWTVATGFALLNWAFDAGCLAAWRGGPERARTDTATVGRRLHRRHGQLRAVAGTRRYRCGGGRPRPRSGRGWSPGRGGVARGLAVPADQLSRSRRRGLDGDCGPTVAARPGHHRCSAIQARRP
ncbi:MAG: hypothetical protein JWM45_14 [Pseudonocardiales bacterium]|nr:hypothetical protein [Pseudonocardiales bacterium]